MAWSQGEAESPIVPTVDTAPANLLLRGGFGQEREAHLCILGGFCSLLVTYLSVK